MKTTARVLLVDDEPTLSGLIAGHLSRYYEVEVAGTGEAAMGQLSSRSFDLVITDGGIPDMKGPAVIAEARRRNPMAKTALITGGSMHECIRLALDHDVGTIIAKTIPFDLDELVQLVKGALTENVFGLGRYLASDASLVEYPVRGSRHISRVRDRILKQPAIASWPESRKYALKLALDESISNAAYHGNQIRKGRTYSFSRQQEVQVVYGEDAERVGVAVADQAGRLSKQTILGKLDACMGQDEEALLQDSGRGLFLIINIVHRLIINIRRGARTEIIMLFRPKRTEIGHRPIIINEL